MKAKLSRLVPLLILLGLVPVSGCTINPATGQPTFTAFMSEDEEARQGRAEHPKVLEEFGGAYNDPELQRYVTSIGDLLASTSERSNVRFTFTVIDSPIVNAFALPGGYVYVTRGLMALAGNEAELAGVIAHEIGHVAARHQAQRYSHAVLANLGLIGLGLATGSGELMNAASVGAAAVLQSYSREEEFEADELGVRYLSRATYDPAAMSTFLQKLLDHSRLEAALEGRPEAADKTNIMATHPRTADRVQRAIAEAGQAPVRNPLVERDLYLDKIDGMLYGDDPKEGFIRGRRFAHPVLRFEFEVPPGFSLVNGTKRVTALGPQSSIILFDRAPKAAGGSMMNYLLRVWGQNADLRNAEEIDVNGLEGATAVTQGNTSRGAVDVRLVAIRYDADSIYRFIFATPPATTASLSSELRRTTYSFRRLSDSEAASLKPQRLRVITVEPGDTMAGLAQLMDFEDHREERLRVLNGLERGQGVSPGQRVKIVAQ